MNVEGIDYDEVADLARQELEESNLPLTTKQTMSTVIQSLVDLQHRSHSWNRSEGFVLHLSDVQAQLYNDFSALSDRLKRSPGQILSYLMEKTLEKGSMNIVPQDLQELVDRLNQNRTVIQHHKSLEITAEDLQSVDKVILQHIKKVKIAEDVTSELFEEKVHVQHCNRVIIPDHLSKLLVISRIQFCKSYVFENRQVAVTQ